MKLVVETFPIPRGWTAERAWAEIQEYNRLLKHRWWKPRYRFCHWGVVMFDEAGTVVPPINVVTGE